MVFKICLIGVGALVLSQMALPVFGNNLTATIVSVGDGDTIRVFIGKKIHCDLNFGLILNELFVDPNTVKLNFFSLPLLPLPPLTNKCA